MKIIFLDFDGPLASDRNFFAAGNRLDFDKNAIGFLNYICDLAPAKIVCISRRANAHSGDDRKEAFRLFQRAGLNIHHIHDNWSAYNLMETSKKDLDAWLAQNPGIDRKDCIVIEDEAIAGFQNIKADTHDGLSTYQYRDLAEWCGLSYVEICRMCQIKGIEPIIREVYRPLNLYTEEKYDEDPRYSRPPDPGQSW